MHAPAPLTDEQRDLCARHYRYAWWWARRTPRPDWMDDDAILSAALLGLVYAARNFKPELWPGEFSSYARHVIRDQIWRAICRERRRVVVIGPDEPPAPVEDADESYDTSPIWALIDQLSPRQKQVVEALYVDGLSHAEAAKKIGIQFKLVNTHRKRAIDKLRAWLAAA